MSTPFSPRADGVTADGVLRNGEPCILTRSDLQLNYELDIDFSVRWWECGECPQNGDTTRSFFEAVGMLEHLLEHAEQGDWIREHAVEHVLSHALRDLGWTVNYSIRLPAE